MPDKSIRERIIETSLRLFEQHGYHKVTVDQIVKESGTSKGGFYHSFKSKDELLYTIHDQFISYVLEKGQEAIHKWKNPVEQLNAIVKSFVVMIDLYKSEVTVFYQESSVLASEYFTDIKVKRDQYKEIVFEVMRNGVDQGLFRRELPVEIMSMAIFGMVNWIYKWYRKNRRYTIQEIADIYADIILHSVMTPEAMQHPAYAKLLLKSNPLKVNPF